MNRGTLHVMRDRQRGFTLIELMISVAIVGILAAVAIPTFSTFMLKSKRVEATIALDKMMRNIHVYYDTKGVLPPSAGQMPLTTACASSTSKTPATVQSQWYSDPGWKAVEFYVGEPGYYQYEWTNLPPQDGVATATGDLDCDGTPGLLVIDVSISTGAQFETITTDLTD